MESIQSKKTNLFKQVNKLLGGKKTIAVICNQWGDTGKGKFVDFFGAWADIIARGTGGANAGHTIRLGNKEHIFHLIPSGILYDAKGKINIIGSGVAFDPAVVEHEISLLKVAKCSFKNLRISKDAHLVLPQHLLMDRVKENKAGSGKIGTTGRGIGPVYEDHYARIGLTVNDLLNPKDFEKKLLKNLQDKIVLLGQYDKQVIKQIMQHEHLGSGRFYDEKNIFNIKKIVKEYARYGKLFKNNIIDTDTFLRKALGKKKILLEGAQGNLLSIDHGTYPFVTASDCTIAGLSKGVGLRENDVEMTLGIIKAPYMTRVGGGAFPTEFGGTQSAEWCGTSGVTRKTEKEKFGNLSLDQSDEFKLGVAVRMAGFEYGATTGRPRRTGWLDLPFLRYSIQFSSKDVIFTKIDVMDSCKEIKICVAYEYTGPKYNVGNLVLNKGTRLNMAIPEKEVLKYCKPIYKTFPGWLTSIRNLRNIEELPQKLKNIISFIEKEVGVKTRIISVGPDRDETIIIAK
ncbi:MAG: adenylosuccinate synthase [Candidatus Zambryskibacteria bacterium]|nr:adenylosuccinate synthase [Candidatus Zambryskibacteria bacterium]